MIRVLVCDGEGTLGLPNPPTELLSQINNLQQLGIVIAVATNQSSEVAIKQTFANAGLKSPAIVVTKRDVGAVKPSPLFIEAISRKLKTPITEIAYLGDSDKTDMLCAINAKVLPFAALYSDSSLAYGLPVQVPKAFFVDYLPTFGIQPAPYFGWTCQKGNIDIRALFLDHARLNLTQPLKSLLKSGGKPTLGSRKIPLVQIVFQYFVSQAFFSGLASEVDIITTYPGHDAGRLHPLLDDFSQQLTRIFRNRHISNLLIRHTTAPASHLSRERAASTQFRTLHVNPVYKKRVKGRTVLVLDDFSTNGYSFEAARNMLLLAGATRVVCVAIAKYKSNHISVSPTCTWDPFAPCILNEKDLNFNTISGERNESADDYFAKTIYAHYSR